MGGNYNNINEESGFSYPWYFYFYKADSILFLKTAYHYMTYQGRVVIIQIKILLANWI